MTITQDVQNLLATKEFGFANSKFPVTAEFVAGSEKARLGYIQIMGVAGDFAKNAGIGAGVAAVSMATLGQFDPIGIFAGAAAGAINSVTKPRGGRGDC